MDHIHATQPISEVIAGGAAAADALGASWAIERGIPCKFYGRSGKACSVSRSNKESKDAGSGHAQSGCAFPGERGTADLVRRARNLIATAAHASCGVSKAA